MRWRSQQPWPKEEWWLEDGWHVLVLRKYTRPIIDIARTDLRRTLTVQDRW